MPEDRVYQGMTIAFDFSVEEIWVPLYSGATLVAAPPGPSLVGRDLSQFLEARRITALCCVPTLLATLDDDLPSLRFILVSGEACPQNLVERWYSEGRTFLNVYGPTEATVTATWTMLVPDKPVTIGVPLPTYKILILAPDEPRLVEKGGIGEICIAGIGLARGYVNRPDLTDKAFIPDFLGLDRQPVRPDLPDRRSGPHHGQGRDRISRPARRPGEDPGLPDRAGGDRIRHHEGAGDRPGRRRHLPAGTRHGRAGRLLHAPP